MYNWNNKEKTILDMAVVDMQNRLSSLEKVRPVNLTDVEKDIKAINKEFHKFQATQRQINKDIGAIIEKLGEKQAQPFWTRLFK